MRFFHSPKINNNKGVAVYIAIVIMTVILGVSLGMADIVIKQIKITSVIGDSIRAFYAADTGMEKVLFYDSVTVGTQPDYGLCYLWTTVNYCRVSEGWTGNLLCKDSVGVSCVSVMKPTPDNPTCAACECCLSNYMFATEKQYYRVEAEFFPYGACPPGYDAPGGRCYRTSAIYKSIGTYRPSGTSRAIEATIQY